MEISKQDIMRINEEFGGNLRNDASLDFAIQMQDNKRLGPYKKLAYLFRAILIDHPFSDGNKRTVMWVAYKFADEIDKKVDRDLLIHQITSIASRNIQEIRNVEWRLKTAVK